MGEGFDRGIFEDLKKRVDDLEVAVEALEVSAKRFEKTRKMVDWSLRDPIYVSTVNAHQDVTERKLTHPDPGKATATLIAYRTPTRTGAVVITYLNTDAGTESVAPGIYTKVADRKKGVYFEESVTAVIFPIYPAPSPYDPKLSI